MKASFELLLLQLLLQVSAWDVSAFHCSKPAAAFDVSSKGSRIATNLGSLASSSSEPDRRTVLMNGVLLCSSALLGKSDPAQATFGFFSKKTTATALDYKAVAHDIATLITANPNWGPTLVRLAWHSSGTYDKVSQTGGSYLGTSRFKEELDHGANAGLRETAVEWLEPIYQKYRAKGLSYGDLYTLSGVTAIQTLGGPTIPWSSGRVDATDPSAATPDGRLPAADSGPPGADSSDADHLRSIFYRMGFNDQEIVVLSGAHALGRCHPTASGYDGPWTATPTSFNNLYYKFLTELKWIPKEWDGPFQYVDVPTGRFMMLPADLVLLQDEAFAKWIKVYGEDAKRFNADFSNAFQKLEELGTKNLTPTEWS